MSSQPTLRTERLLLRPFRLSDAETVRRLAGDREVAATTLRIPHPYRDGLAEAWIRSLADAWPEREAVFAVVPAGGEDSPAGSVGLQRSPEHRRAEIGYWIGRPFQGRGYATEATAEVVRWAFEELCLHRLTANCFAGNAPSSGVLRKLGMEREGIRRQHFEKWGEWIDVELWGLLRADWRASVDRQGQ
jgi:RimJ/RimL family protein N-acetyltransferase